MTTLLFGNALRISPAHPDLRSVGRQVKVFRICQLHEHIGLPRVLNQAAYVWVNVGLDVVLLQRNLPDFVCYFCSVRDSDLLIFDVRPRRAPGLPGDP